MTPTCRSLHPSHLPRLRTYLMYTTAFIMLFGVIADVGVVYFAK